MADLPENLTLSFFRIFSKFLRVKAWFQIGQILNQHGRLPPILTIWATKSINFKVCNFCVIFLWGTQPPKSHDLWLVITLLLPKDFSNFGNTGLVLSRDAVHSKLHIGWIPKIHKILISLAKDHAEIYTLISEMQIIPYGCRLSYIDYMN